MPTDNPKLKNDPIYARVLNERIGTPVRQKLIKDIQSKKRKY
jgi:hypothetical protein